MKSMETRLAFLFKRYFDRTATEEEKTELMARIDDEENVEEVKKLMDEAWNEFGASAPVFTDELSKAMLRRVLQKDTDHKLLNRSGTMRLNWIRIAAAAAVLVFLATGGYLWYTSNDQAGKMAVNNSSVKIQDVAPGGNKATLSLANGKTIALDSTQNGILTQQGNTNVIKVKSGLLTYNRRQGALQKAQPSTRSIPREIQQNTLRTPRGGQYQLVLPDGSKVWLNAASSITFPTAFTGKERRVEVTGEAYFEIHTDDKHPFIVGLPPAHPGGNRPEIQVLGTYFNVNAYSNEPAVRTTLVEGAVRIVAKGNSKILKPGQQAAIQRNSNRIQIGKANIEEAIAWKNGLFYFNGEDMATIMHKISRWYDVQVTYQNAVPEGHYSGIISRNTNLSEVLKILRLSGIAFKIQGKRLVVIN